MNICWSNAVGVTTLAGISEVNEINRATVDFYESIEDFGFVIL